MPFPTSTRMMHSIYYPDEASLQPSTHRRWHPRMQLQVATAPHYVPTGVNMDDHFLSAYRTRHEEQQQQQQQLHRHPLLQKQSSAVQAPRPPSQHQVKAEAEADTEEDTVNETEEDGSKDDTKLKNPKNDKGAPDQGISEEIKRVVFCLCRKNMWAEVLEYLEDDPRLGNTTMTMDNHIKTTLLHQAITSKGAVPLRAEVIRCILSRTPAAAGIQNGYGSLPLHVICQRNTKMDAKTKESLIRALVDAHEPALVQPGGVGERTPLHIMFTDYLSPQLTKMMIEKGSKACFMTDKKGFLPAHVACSRHCSPEKMGMLVSANPKCLTQTNNNGMTLFDLACSCATNSHPNRTLIDYLEKILTDRGIPLSSDQKRIRNLKAGPSRKKAIARSKSLRKSGRSSPARNAQDATRRSQRGRSVAARAKQKRRRSRNTEPSARVVKQEETDSDTTMDSEAAASMYAMRNASRRPVKKRKVTAESLPTQHQLNGGLRPEEDPVNLLLHFSRNLNEVKTEMSSSTNDCAMVTPTKMPMTFAKV